jgi:hypothetical protein
MHISGDAGTGDLVLRKAAQDDSSLLVDCLERVSCVKVSTLVVYYYLYLCLSSFVRCCTWQNLIVHGKSLVQWSLKVLTLPCERSLKLLSSKLAEVERREWTLTSKNEGLKIDLVDACSAHEVVVRETEQSKLRHFQVSVRKRLAELLRDTETSVSALGG